MCVGEMCRESAHRCGVSLDGLATRNTGVGGVGLGEIVLVVGVLDSIFEGRAWSWTPVMKHVTHVARVRGVLVRARSTKCSNKANANNQMASGFGGRVLGAQDAWYSKHHAHVSLSS